MTARPETFGERVRRLRMKRGLTLRTLARAVGVSAVFMSDVEHGRRFPSEVTLRSLARVLHVAVARLQEVRLTRETCRILERDPELLRVVIDATQDAEQRRLVLDAAGRSRP